MPDEAPRRLEPAPPRRAGARRLIRPLLLVVVPAVVALVGLYWYAMSGRYVATENAYVKADMVAISPDINGRVIAVEVAENQLVRQGDVLFRLDPEPFQIALDMAEAKMLAVRNDIEASRAEFHQIEAEIGEATERVRFHAQQAERQRGLQGRGISTEVRLERGRGRADGGAATGGGAAGEAAHRARRSSAAIPRAPRSCTRSTGRPRPSATWRLWIWTMPWSAPRSTGVVSRMRLQPGEWLEEGEPAFSIINPATTWIEANLKETQLEHVEVGQQVEIAVDAYPGGLWLGKVASISPATGAEFALIPPQNATGNWVKVVQRLPVRIAVAPRQDQPPLRAGMTVTVSIDTEREPKLAQLINGAVAAVRGED